MTRNDFFNDPDGGYATLKQKNAFSRAWRRVIAFEASTGLSLDNGFTKEQYIDLFNSMGIWKTSIFANYKHQLTLYVRYLVANAALPEVQERILSSVTANDIKINKDCGVQYFKNVNTLHEAIQKSILDSRRFDPTLYDLPAAILYLAWYGLSREQIVDFKKSDIVDGGIMLNGGKIEVPRHIMMVLERLRDAKGYYQQARAVIFHTYACSDNLIRTEHNSRITPKMTHGIVNRLNSLSGGDYSLCYSVAYQSGIFYRAYILECESTRFDLSNPAFASKVFCEDLSDNVKRKIRIRDYNLYKQIFY